MEGWEEGRKDGRKKERTEGRKERKDERTMGGDEYVNQLDCGDHITMYTYIKISR